MEIKGNTTIKKNLVVDKLLGILEGGSSPQYFTYFQGGDQSADLTYTLPTALPGSTAFLKSTNAGVTSWDTNTYLTSLTGALLLDQTTPQTVINGAPTFTGLLSNGNIQIGTTSTAYNLDMRDTDVTHGITTVANTNTYGLLKEINGTKGGLYVDGFSDTSDNPAVELRGFMTSDPDDGIPAVTIDSYAANGTGVQSLGATKTILSVQNNGSAKITVLGNGNTTYTGNVTAASLIKTGGTSSQFLKADGSVDTSTYLTSVTAHNLLSATHGDTLTDSVVLGDVMVGNATPKWARLAGNATTTKKFLRQTGNGAISAVPAWDTVTSTDVGLGNLTNDKQVKGLVSGTTNGHIVTWGADGYTVADGGAVPTGTVTSVGLSSTNSTLSIGSSPVTSSGTITADINLSHANLWAAQQTFGSGYFRLAGATSGYTSINSHATATTWTMTLPSTAGTNTYVLTTDGSGNCTWAAPGGGTSYTFANSLVNTAGTVTLVNDSATPGASKYYGTNGSSTLGFFALPGGGGAPGGSDTNIQFNDSSSFGGSGNLTYNKTTNILRYGLSHSITNGYNDVVFGSYSNLYYAADSMAFGYSNTLWSCSHSYILGSSNYIGSTSNSAVVTGYGNTVYSPFSNTEGVNNQSFQGASNSHTEGTGNKNSMPYSHVEGLGVEPQQAYEHAEGTALNDGGNIVGTFKTYKSNLTLVSYQAGGTVELKVAGVDRIKIPVGWTFSMEFNIMQVDPDYSVNTWHLVATAQNNGVVVMGVGKINSSNAFVSAMNSDWLNDGTPAGASPTIVATGPGQEDATSYLNFDTSSSTGEIIIKRITSETVLSNIYATVTINKIYTAPSQSNS